MSTDPAAKAPSTEAAPPEVTATTPDAAETEVIDQSAARASRPEDAPAVWSAPGAAPEQADPLQDIRSRRPWHGSPAEAATDGPDPAESPDSVWSRKTAAPSAQVERGERRPLTVAWGLVVAVVGAILIAVAAGMRLDLVATSIILLTGIGLALLVLAVLPSRRQARR